MREPAGQRQGSIVSFRRHDLVYVAPDVWALIVDCCSSCAELPLLKLWANRAWPVIARRRAQGEDVDLVPVGVPLPPAAGKSRLALLMPPKGILQCVPPCELSEAARVAASDWHPTIDALLALGARIDVEPAVIGSVLWEHLTGLRYLSRRSDLDVLWPVPAGCDVLSLLSSIAAIQRAAPLRIDGEIIFPNGSAVNWRELWNAHQAADRVTVLAKSTESVRLLEIDSVLRPVAHA